MPSIQFGGVSSGLDTASIISALMGAEKLPLTRLRTMAATMGARRNAFSTLATRLNELLAKAQAFTLTSAGSARSANSSAPASFTATAGSGAIPAGYSISVDRLATSTRATSTAAIGTPVTDASLFLADLPLAGTPTAGTIGMVVGGTIVSVAVGDPATTSLQSVLDTMASAIQAGTGGTVTGSVVANKVQFTVTGATADVEVRFSVGSDTSNLLGLTGLAGSQTVAFGQTTGAITASGALGVVRTTTKLDDAGLTGLASTAVGQLTINGVAIDYDTTVDTLGAVLSRINSSTAGVIASLDRTGDRIVLTNKSAGPVAINIVDTTGSLGAALRLGPGTTAAQQIGVSSKVTVDGRAVFSDTNQVSNAIDGVILNLIGETTGPATLTVGVDATAIEKALKDFVDSYNALADTLDNLTTHVQGAAVGLLEREALLPGLKMGIRSDILAVSVSGTAAMRSLIDLGVTSGKVGAKPGTTTRLSLDTAKLGTALANDPAAVAQLLGGAGGLMPALVTRIKGLTGSTGPVQAAQDGIDAALRANTDQQARIQRRIDGRQAALEAKFALFEARLAKLQSTQSQISTQAASFTSRRDY